MSTVSPVFLWIVLGQNGYEYGSGRAPRGTSLEYNEKYSSPMKIPVKIVFIKDDKYLVDIKGEDEEGTYYTSKNRDSSLSTEVELSLYNRANNRDFLPP
jgi:hypothetical protein